MLRVAFVSMAFFGSLPVMIAVQLFLARIRSPWWGPCSVAYYRMLRALLRIKVRVDGELLTGQPVLLVANHVSWVDIVVLASLAPMVFVAKSEVARWPLIGGAARAQKVIFVDRTRRQQTAAAVAEIAQRLAERHPVVLFAEGTSSDGNRVLAFRTALIGAVEAACSAAGMGEIKLQPLSICYVAQQGLPMGRHERPLVAWYGDLDFFPHFRAFIRRGVVDAVVGFGAPLVVDGAADRKHIARSLEASVRTLTAKARRGQPAPAAAAL